MVRSVRNDNHDVTLLTLLGEKRLDKIDLFDRVQLAYVVRTCQHSETLSEAGRKRFAVTREKRQTANEADRLANTGSSTFSVE